MLGEESGMPEEKSMRDYFLESVKGVKFRRNGVSYEVTGLCESDTRLSLVNVISNDGRKTILPLLDVLGNFDTNLKY